MKHTVQKTPVVHGWTRFAATFSGQQRTDYFPLVVRYIATRQDCLPKSSLESLFAPFGNLLCQQGLGWWFAATRGIVLIGLLCLSYQTVVLAPGYFLALAAGIVKTEPPRRWIGRSWPLVLAGMVFTAGFIPAYVFRIRAIRAIWWNAGPHNEFVFTPPHGFLSTIAEAARFLTVDTWLTIQGQVSPAAEDSTAAIVTTAVILAGATAGLGFALTRAIRSRDWHAESALGVYAAVTLGLLFTLVLARQLTLSPTRHLIAYLPLLAVLAGWGFWSAIGRVVRTPIACRFTAAAIFTVAMAGVFYAGFGQFEQEREDPFNEQALMRVVRETHADLAVTYDFTQQLRAMPALQATVPVADTAAAIPATAPKSPRHLLFISQRSAFNSEECRGFVKRLSGDIAAESDKCAEPGRIRLLIEKTSNVESDFSARTKNGSNGLFVTLVDLSP